MSRRLSLILLVLAPFGAGFAVGQPLSGADLVRELSDNTLTGFNGSLWFSEYHAPDGRVFGHNGGRPNQDACWKVRGDAVCYYYPRSRRDEPDGTVEFCWHLERAGANGYEIAPVDRAEGGVARLEPGNVRRHTDGGRAWTCEALISERRPSRPAPSTVAAPGPIRPGPDAPISAGRSLSPTRTAAPP